MRFIFMILLLLVVACNNEVPLMEDENLANTQLEVELEEYSMDDVLAHSTEDDCWTVVQGKVYDVTEFVSEHPNDMIKQGCGKDATELFSKHSNKAEQNLGNYLIGRLI